jgi:DNA-binding beta-propeller fold protein YncE
MSQHDRPQPLSPDQLAESLDDLAGTRRPDYRDDLFQRTARTRQRPAWTFIERWLPMSVITVTPRGAPMRAAWLLLITGVLLAALVTSLLIAGSGLLRSDPDRFSAMVPSLVLDGTWDGATIEGLSVPADIDVGPDGNLYIVNAGSHEIIVVDPTGRAIRRWGEQGSGKGQFLFERRPPTGEAELLGGIAVAGDGSVYVADLANDRVQQFTPEGVFVRAWGGYGAEDGQFLEPLTVAVGPDGSVYVVDDVRDDIQRFTPEGMWVQTIGRHGSADGEMDNTGGIAVDPQGTLLNADFANQRVQAWDEDGTFLWSKGGPSDPNLLRNPGDVDVDAEGRVLVADDDGIKLFSEGRSPDSVWTPPGWQFGWLAVADGGIVYASSPASGRIQRLSIELQEAEAAVPSAAPSQLAPSAAVGKPGPSPAVAGGPEQVRVGSIFPLPFSAELPSTTVGATRSRGWWLSEELPGYASFQFVRDEEVTPAYVTAYLPAGVFRDPCHPEDGMLTTSESPSVDELVEALTHQLGVRASPVTDIAFGNHAGKMFELDNNIDVSRCPDQPWLRQWTYRSGGLDEETTAESEGLSGSHQRIAIVDVDGIPVLIEGWHIGARGDEVLEADALFESIRFE